MRIAGGGCFTAAAVLLSLLVVACGGGGNDGASPRFATLSAGASGTTAALDSLNQKLAAAGEPTLAPGTKPNATPTLPALPTVTPGPAPTPTPCGPLSSADDSIAIQEQYGPARNCSRYGSQWVMTTLGKPTQGAGGVVAVFDCAPDDQGCLDGGQATSGEWQTFPSPVGGPVAILTYHAPELLLSGGICFDLSAKTFNTSATCGEAP